MIVYFSATGNDKWVAEQLGQATSDEAVDMRDLLRQGCPRVEAGVGGQLVLVTPTYFEGLPSITLDWIRATEFEVAPSAYACVVATYGAGFGNVGLVAQEEMAARGVVLDATFSLKMVDNWTPYFRLDDPDFVRQGEAAAEAELARVAAAVASRSREFLGKEMSDEDQALGTAFYNDEVRKTSHFSVSGACIGCGLCARQCPLAMIEMAPGPAGGGDAARHPVWKPGKCTTCLGCQNRCPVNAIRFSLPDGEDTLGHGQYVNPRVRLG